MTEEQRNEYIKLKEKKRDDYNLFLVEYGYEPNAEVCPDCFDGGKYINGSFKECGTCEGSQVINEYLKLN